MKKVQNADYWRKRSMRDTDRDWKETGKNWVEDYVISVDHPHREVILEAIGMLDFNSVIDMGCNAGPNLMVIRQEYPDVDLAGFDVSPQAIKKAKEILPEADLKVGEYKKIPFKKTFDLGICDASLMYVPPQEVQQVMGEINRVVSKFLVIVERVSKKEQNNGYIWSRDYPKLLKENGWEVVNKIKLNSKLWPHSKGWAKMGYVIVAVRA